MPGNDPWAGKHLGEPSIPAHVNQAAAAWSRMSPGTRETGRQAKPGDWICHKCGELNFAGRDVCHHVKCHAPRQTQAVPTQVGDWRCQHCNNANSGHTDICPNCGRAAPSRSSASTSIPGYLSEAQQLHFAKGVQAPPPVASSAKSPPPVFNAKSQPKPKPPVFPGSSSEPTAKAKSPKPPPPVCPINRDAQREHLPNLSQAVLAQAAAKPVPEGLAAPPMFEPSAAEVRRTSTESFNIGDDSSSEEHQESYD
jgi:hypothetical protein